MQQNTSYGIIFIINICFVRCIHLLYFRTKQILLGYVNIPLIFIHFCVYVFGVFFSFSIAALYCTILFLGTC